MPLLAPACPGRVARGLAWMSPGIRDMMLGAFFFSIMSLLVKAAGQTLHTNLIVLVRAFVTLAISWAVLRRMRVSPWGNDRRLLVVRGFTGFVALLAFYWSVVHLPLAEATVIQYTNPVFTALIAAVWLRERIGAVEVGLVAVSLGGVLLVARPASLFGEAAGGLPPVAVAIALTGALLSGVAYTMVRRLRATEKPMVVVFYFALVSSVGAVPLAIPVLQWPTPTEWLLLLGVGVSTQLGQTFMTRGLHQETAGRATAAGYVQVVFAAAWGAVFFGDLPDAATGVGAALIVGSTLALAARTRRTGASAEAVLRP